MTEDAARIVDLVAAGMWMTAGLLELFRFVRKSLKKRRKKVKKMMGLPPSERYVRSLSDEELIDFYEHAVCHGNEMNMRESIAAYRREVVRRLKLRGSTTGSAADC